MTGPKVPCVTGCPLPGRFAVELVAGGKEGTYCGRHLSHALELVTRFGPAWVTQIVRKNYR